jgi:hypothetical protein
VRIRQARRYSAAHKRTFPCTSLNQRACWESTKAPTVCRLVAHSFSHHATPQSGHAVRLQPDVPNRHLNIEAHEIHSVCCPCRCSRAIQNGRFKSLGGQRNLSSYQTIWKNKRPQNIQTHPKKNGEIDMIYSHTVFVHSLQTGNNTESHCYSFATARIPRLVNFFYHGTPSTHNHPWGYFLPGNY